MLFRRGRTMLVLVAVFWLWLLLGSADFIAGLFESPFYALLALYGLGVVTLISLAVAAAAVFYLVANRPKTMKAAVPTRDSVRPGFSDLAPVIRLVPRRVADHGAALTNKAAAKWRDLAS
ncbi:hypothetical protein OL239_02395 [Arthrobacter sp. ATA002]|uniref:hypothetical protein n=1 Tax=Arthrobacter sp. ATA002 TaxID=2991715 RepID=UPI0022A78A0B|nr:hypothetical protein [Arthrobacter sp. ATA002]WAP52177.1 hypothetical protein OL239_02395 [Arthrobacter sp. ATA002]